MTVLRVCTRLDSSCLAGLCSLLFCLEERYHQFFCLYTHFLCIVYVSHLVQQDRSRMPAEAYTIQLESRRLFLSILCGAKKVNKVVPAAHIPRAHLYAEIEMPASVLHELIQARDSQLRM